MSGLQVVGAVLLLAGSALAIGGAIWFAGDWPETLGRVTSRGRR